MIVVDTSVWVSILNGQPTRPAQQFTRLLEEGAELALTDIVLTEVLQGLRSEREVALVEDRLSDFAILRLEGLQDFRRAAELYRTARRSGVTVRKTLDVLIASPCVRDDVALLHDDVDFDRLATCTPLRVVPVV